MIEKRRKKGILARLAAALLAAALIVTSLDFTAYAAGNVASTMKLKKAEGTVNVSSGTGKKLPILENMNLYNGYSVGTVEQSYAWIDLDTSKLIKLDAASEAGIRKHGKKLEVLLQSGNLFFDVSEPLGDDESLNIRTSTMAVGIRGTSGWVEIIDERNVMVYILEGTVELSVADPVTGGKKTETVSGGERALCVVYDKLYTGGYQM